MNHIREACNERMKQKGVITSTERRTCGRRSIPVIVVEPISLRYEHENEDQRDESRSQIKPHNQHPLRQYYHANDELCASVWASVWAGEKYTTSTRPRETQCHMCGMSAAAFSITALRQICFLACCGGVAAKVNDISNEYKLSGSAFTFR